MLKNIFVEYKNKKKILNEKCDELTKKIDEAILEINTLLNLKSEFIDSNIAVEWKNLHFNLINDINSNGNKKLRKTVGYSKFVEKKNHVISIYMNVDKMVSQHNNQVANEKIKEAYNIIGNIEGRKLDQQQMQCIVKDVHNHLVIAGAGTGKTTTIVGKIKFLLNSYKLKAEDILVLSFTNASAVEMKERINKETGAYIEATTFHKLGLNIISKVDNIVPRISHLNQRKFIKEQMIENMKKESYLQLLSTYILYNSVAEKNEFEFKNKLEYDEYLQLNPPITIKNERVKSYGELDIANFLNQNNVNYIYENPYELDTRTSEYGQYFPDFYLPDHNIYIEYFAINKQGEVPSYFSKSNGKTASETYQNSMKWKRELHSQNKTKLIEAFAHEKFEGVLLENLKRNLENENVELVEKSGREMWKQIKGQGESILDGLVELFETVVNLIKSNNFTIEDIRALNTGNNVKRNETILCLIEPIFKSYCESLKANNEIDFNDMINVAKKYVEAGKFKNPYKYVVIDEYQDISRARFSLLKSLRSSMDYDLFCVGDDWQSIYRFAGSDIGFIMDFSKYWGPTEISKIETTYRFTKNLIDISGQFVMQNPMQIKKKIKGNSIDSGFALAEINGYTEKYAVDFMSKKLEDLPQNSTVFFIGRYSFDVKILSDSGLFQYQYNNTSNSIEIISKQRQDLKMNFITAHKSKGLQADYVFIINNKNCRTGFPSKIQDEPILELLLENSDKYPNAEERRLFYVALTRAKKKVIILTVKDQESCFARELKDKYAEDLKKEKFTCPVCGGYLVHKTGRYGEFFGCSNYKKNGCKYTRKIIRGI